MKLCIVLLIVLLASSVAAASWSGSQTVTFQLEETGIATIYTTVLDYELRENRFLTLIVDTHPTKGIDADVSVTEYFRPFNFFLLYTSAGVRRGVWNSSTPWRPYISFTYRF